MEAVFMPDHAISAYNRSRNDHPALVNGFFHRRISGSLSHESLLNIHGSLFGVPPSVSSSFSSFSPSRSSSSAPPFSSFSSFSSFGSNTQQQPPLLPLPSTKIQALPSPNSNRKINRSVKDQTQEPKKLAKSVSFNLKKESSRSSKDRPIAASSSPVERLGPDPSDLPTKVSQVMNSSPMKTSCPDKFEEFSGSIFSLSPPPSSLPLPKFSLRPKSKCNAEATRVVDAGATDDLRRLLRLQ